MKTRFMPLILLLLAHISLAAQGSPTIKVAIIDNFRYQPFVLAKNMLNDFPIVKNNYAKDYQRGVELAILEAKQYGYNIVYRMFTYKRKTITILKAFADAEAWQPNVIIGPQATAHFLNLRNFFRDILVLSPMASSERVARLPENYYSLIYPDPYSAKAMYAYITKAYPGRAVYGIVETTCVTCVTVSHAFGALYQKDRGEPFRAILF